MSEARELVAAEGTAPNGDNWIVLYRPEDEAGLRHDLRFLVNGGERDSGCGFEIPERTEIGFGGGLEAGRGHF